MTRHELQDRCRRALAAVFEAEVARWKAESARNQAKAAFEEAADALKAWELEHDSGAEATQ